MNLIKITGFDFLASQNSNQENLKMTIEKDWDTCDHQFHLESTEEERYFVFVHQTAQQKRLTDMYGGKLKFTS